MERFNISEKYRLEIRWDKIESLGDYAVRLIGCRLEGPVLADIVALQKKDSIRLDFSKQYIILVHDYYIATLSWDGYTRIDNIIYLDNVILKNKHVESVPPLGPKDYIVIDTANHEDEKHNYYLNYVSYLVKNDGALYTFGDN